MSNATYILLSRTVSQISRSINEIKPIAFDRGASVLYLTNSFSETSENIAISHILLKPRLFGLHFYRRHDRSIFNHFDVINRLPKLANNAK